MTYGIGYPFLTHHKKNPKYTHSATLEVIGKEPLFRTVYQKEERRESEFTCLFCLSSCSKFALQGGKKARSLTLTSRWHKILAASQEVRSNTMCCVTLRCLAVLRRAEIPSLMLAGLGRHTSWATLASLGLGRGREGVSGQECGRKNRLREYEDVQKI